MPYSSIHDLPENIRSHLPKKAQEIYMKAFNSAWQQYDEVTAHKVAWSAVKKRYYKKSDGKWSLIK